jgi:hypothetical protein
MERGADKVGHFVSTHKKAAIAVATVIATLPLDETGIGEAIDADVIGGEATADVTADVVGDQVTDEAATEEADQVGGALQADSGGARFVVGADGTVTDTLGNDVPDAISLGKYPAYTDLGAQTGARTFSMSDEAWNAMSGTEQWIRNQQFLDQAIARGSQINLASPLTAENLTGGSGQEIEYLLKQGFTPNAEGSMMLPPG